MTSRIPNFQAVGLSVQASISDALLLKLYLGSGRLITTHATYIHIKMSVYIMNGTTARYNML